MVWTDQGKVRQRIGVEFSTIGPRRVTRNERGVYQIEGTTDYVTGDDSEFDGLFA